MSVISIAHVYLLPIYGESKVNCELVNDTLLVRVYVSHVTIRNNLNNYRTLLPKFATYLIGHDIRQFDFTDVPQEITEVFRFVCRQINNGVPIRGLMDDFGRYLFRQETADRRELVDRREISAPPNTSLPTTSLPITSPPNTSLPQIMTSLGGALASLVSTNPSPHQQPTIIPTNTNTRELQQRNVIDLITQLGQIASAVSRTNSNTHSNSNANIPMPNLQPVSSSPVQAPLQILASTHLQVPIQQPTDRFVENRAGATREIIPFAEDASPNLTWSQNIRPQTQIPQTSSTIHPPVSMQRIRYVRESIPHEIIQRAAVAVNNKLVLGRVKPPKFSKQTRANYKKIRNFIYHHTNQRLSTDEIKIFIVEISKLNPQLDSGDITVDLD